MISDSDTDSIYDSDVIDSDVENDLYSKLHHDISTSIDSSAALNTDLLLTPSEINKEMRQSTLEPKLTEAKLNETETDRFSPLANIQSGVVQLPAATGEAVNVLLSLSSRESHIIEQREEVSPCANSKRKTLSSDTKHSKRSKSVHTLSSSDNESDFIDLSSIDRVPKKLRSGGTQKIQNKRVAKLRHANELLESLKQKLDKSYAEKIRIINAKSKKIRKTLKRTLDSSVAGRHSSASSGVLTLSSESESEELQSTSIKRICRNPTEDSSNKQDSTESIVNISSNDSIVISSDSEKDSIVVISSDSDSDGTSVILTEPDSPNFKLNVTDVNLISDSSDDDQSSDCSEKRPSIPQDRNYSSINASGDLWKIDKVDSLRSSKFFRFQQNRSPIDHSKYCQQKKCFFCGGFHLSTYCNNRVCHKCWYFGHSPRYCCYPVKLCSLCKRSGHNFMDCTDQWRRYHLTTDPHNIVQSKQPEQESKMYCCFCGRNGHFMQDCPQNKGDTTTTLPIVTTYFSPGSPHSDSSFLGRLREKYTNIISGDFKTQDCDFTPVLKKTKPQRRKQKVQTPKKRMQEVQFPQKRKQKKKSLLTDTSKTVECSPQFPNKSKKMKKLMNKNRKEKQKLAKRAFYGQWEL